MTLHMITRNFSLCGNHSIHSTMFPEIQNTQLIIKFLVKIHRSAARPINGISPDKIL